MFRSSNHHPPALNLFWLEPCSISLYTHTHTHIYNQTSWGPVRLQGAAYIVSLFFHTLTYFSPRPTMRVFLPSNACPHTYIRRTPPKPNPTSSQEVPSPPPSPAPASASTVSPAEPSDLSAPSPSSCSETAHPAGGSAPPGWMSACPSPHAAESSCQNASDARSGREWEEEKMKG